MKTGSKSLKKRNLYHESIEQCERDKIAIEKRKLDLMNTQTKNDELNYRINLVDKYTLWKQQGMTDKQILRICPDAKLVIDALKEDGEYKTIKYMQAKNYVVASTGSQKFVLVRKNTVVFIWKGVSKIHYL
jgi:hypothetical protein